MRDFGLSPPLGPVGYPTGDDAAESRTTFNRPCSEETQRAVDSEVARLVREAEATAIDVISRNRAALDRLVVRLFDAETLDGAEVYEVLGRPTPERVPDLGAPLSPASGRRDALVRSTAPARRRPTR